MFHGGAGSQREPRCLTCCSEDGERRALPPQEVQAWQSRHPRWQQLHSLGGLLMGAGARLECGPEGRLVVGSELRKAVQLPTQRMLCAAG